MKRALAILLIMIFCMVGLSACASESDLSIILQINNPIMTVNGVEKNIDEQGTTPIIVSGRTLLPVRAVVEEMGGTVGWNGDTQEVTLSYKEDTIRLTIDSATAYLNEKAETLDTAPIIISGRTMLPIRFIAEGFGFSVGWDGDSQTVSITNSVSETISDSEATTATKKAEMKQIFDEVWDSDILGNCDVNVTLNDKEYHITSTALDYKEWTPQLDYEITINDNPVIYNTGDCYYNISDIYIADPNPDDDSVILFILPVTDNGYQTVTAYKYSPTVGIVQLNFDVDDNGELKSVLYPGRHCGDFELSEDGTFGLVTGSRTNGMWGLQKYFRLNENDVLVFKQQDTYTVHYWGTGEKLPKMTDSESHEARVVSYEEAKRILEYSIENEQDYEMLLQGYYKCSQSYGDLREGDYFKLVCDDNKGNVMFVTNDGREGWINVNELGSDQKTREIIGGHALMLAG